MVRVHADGYAGFEDIYRSGDIREVACMAHVRRKFVDVHKAQGSAIADEAIRRIAQLYAVEKAARGLSPDKRIEIRQAEAKPVFNGLELWLSTQLPDISGKSPLATAIRYARTRMARLFVPAGHQSDPATSGRSWPAAGFVDTLLSQHSTFLELHRA